MPYAMGNEQFAQGDYMPYYMAVPPPGMYPAVGGEPVVYGPGYVGVPQGHWNSNHNERHKSERRSSSSMDSTRSAQSWRPGDGNGGKRTKADKSFAGKSAVSCMVGLYIQDMAFAQYEKVFQEPIYECLVLERQHDEAVGKDASFSTEFGSAKSMLKHAINVDDALQKISPDMMRQIALDYDGSKLLQKILSSTGPTVAEALFSILSDTMMNVSIDVYGNYVVQCLMRSKSDTVVRELGDIVVQKALPLSLNFYGCRVMQAAIQLLPSEYVASICDAIEPFAIHCLQSQNANHVVNAILELPETQRPPKAVNIHASICKHALSIATHKYAFKVLQTALGSDISISVSKQTVDRIKQALYELSYDEFGNYLLQYMIESNCYGSRGTVIEFISRAPLLTLACNKYGSNVLEKSLLHSTSQQSDVIVLQLLHQCRQAGPVDQILANVTSNKYGNYVMQRILAVSSLSTRQIISSYLLNHMDFLMSSKYGRHITRHLQQTAGTMYG